jgi:hypothetical protein
VAFVQNRSFRLIKIENGIEISKTQSEYTNNDKRLFFMDVKAMNILYYILDKSEFDRLYSIKMLRDICFISNS